MKTQIVHRYESGSRGLISWNRIHMNSYTGFASNWLISKEMQNDFGTYRAPWGWYINFPIARDRKNSS